MLANRVDLRLHLEILLLDVHPVPFVEKFEHLRALQRLLGHVLVNVRHFTVKYNPNLLELAEELFELALVLLMTQLFLL